jgi:adenylate cyclase class 1
MEKELIKNKRLFELFNTEKINRAIGISHKKGKIAFYAVPFLIHTNLKGFPGFLDAPELLGGINLFEWTDAMKSAVKELFPDSKILNEGAARLFPSKYSVESLLIMGSIASIAQNEKSDYDYWVCIAESSISPKELDLLKRKLKLIEGWADKHDTEVHFFPTDIEKVKKCDFGQSDKESAGSSQGRILKEEFYRTSIFVSGKIPLWWMMPVGASNDVYNKYKESLKTSIDLDYQGFVDLGNLENIPADEYFGAALWQMNKAMSSPYKSVLKMGLLESFIDPGYSHELLCDKIKKGVFNSGDSGKSLDSYLIMIDRILDYHNTKGRKDVVDLVRKCFYIKAGEKIKVRSQESGVRSQKKEIGYKESVMRSYVEKWGWGNEVLDELNNYQDWGFEKVLRLGNQVHSFMVETYKNLTDKMKNEADVKRKISDVDLTVLGRRLFTLYSKKENKVEYLKRAFEEGLLQERLTFSVGMDKNRMPVWSMYRGQLSKEMVAMANDKLLKRGNILDIIIWLVYNRLCDESTSFYLIPNPLPISLAEIQTLIKDLQFFFPPVNIADLQNDVLLSAPRKLKIFIVVNFLSQRWVKKIEEATIFYATSWGELFCENYKSQDGIKKILGYVAENPPKDLNSVSNYYKVFIPKGEFSETLYKEINNIILRQISSVK